MTASNSEAVIHLKTAARLLESKKVQTGEANFFCSTALLSAAQILMVPDCVTRATELLRGADPLKGALVNFHAAHHVWNPPTLSDSEKAYPTCGRTEILQWIESFSARELHIRLALNGEPQPALTAASGSCGFTEVATTFAVMGRLQEAMQVLENASIAEVHKHGAWLVVAIEARRAEDASVFERALGELATEKSEPWKHIHLAFGLAGRRPWFGYPFPDY
jgi:hypothetical protein